MYLGDSLSRSERSPGYNLARSGAALPLGLRIQASYFKLLPGADSSRAQLLRRYDEFLIKLVELGGNAEIFSDLAARAQEEVVDGHSASLGAKRSGKLSSSNKFAL